MALLLALSSICGRRVAAAPYPPDGQTTSWQQRDGKILNLRVYGDEFYARTTDEAGFTLVFNPVDLTYYYANRGPDNRLISSGVSASQAVPVGIARHLTDTKAEVAAIHRANEQRCVPGRGAAWAARVKAAQARRAGGGASSNAVPSDNQTAVVSSSTAPVIGERRGLMILVQFPDDPATPAMDAVGFPTTQAKIERYCNERGYTDDGNTGSICDYYSDQSNAQLTLTHQVSAVVTLPYPRNYYNYSDYPANTTLRYCSIAGEAMVRDAVQVLCNMHFDFSGLSIDAEQTVLATNLLFAGYDSGVWAQGLWPHASWVYPQINVGSTTAPIYISRYECTNVPDAAPVLGTVCHELGHLLMDYPDLYDHGYESMGLGRHCLMAYGGSCNYGRTPAPINLYLKDVSGWAEITDLTTTQDITTTLPATGNRGYRLFAPGNTVESFLVENRGRDDRWTFGCPDYGLAIWHVDESVDGNNNEQMTPTQHYQVSLEQADGRFDLERSFLNQGDPGDLYDLNSNIFSDPTSPGSHWWNGTPSNFLVQPLGTPAATMDVRIAYGDYPYLVVRPLSQIVRVYDGSTFTATCTVISNTTWTWSTDVSWVHPIDEPLTQSGSKMFQFAVDASDTFDWRTGTITFTAGALSCTHAITQPSLPYDDHGNDMATATEITLDSPAYGMIDDYSDIDVFKIVIASEGILHLTVNAELPVYLTLNDANGHYLSGIGTDEYENYSFERQDGYQITAGTYYISVVAGDGYAAYDLTCKLAPTVELGCSAAGATLAAHGTACPVFTVASNVLWSWNCNAAWVTSHELVSQFGTREFFCSVTANFSEQSRSAVITFSGGGLTAEYTITQAGATAGEFRNTLIQTLGDGSQSDWTPGIGDVMVGAALTARKGRVSGAITAVGALEFPFRSFFGIVNATNTWGNHPAGCQTGTFTASFVTIPNGSAVDTVIGFGPEAADFWDDLAACVRFNPQGYIDARNGGEYAIVNWLAYQPGVAYQVEMSIDVASRSYSVTVTPEDRAPVRIADHFAFRDEHSDARRLTTFSYLTWTGGTQTISGLNLAALGPVNANNTWGNHAVAAQRGSFSASFYTTPASFAVDTVIGFASGAAGGAADLAACVWFNPAGKVEVRNGAGFASVTDFFYQQSRTYRVDMEVDVVTKRYRATVTPQGGEPVVIADNFLFVSEQAAVAQLDHFAYRAAGGGQALNGLEVVDGGAILSTHVRGNRSMEPQTGQFVATFTTIPNTSAVDTVMGFSHGAAVLAGDVAAGLRFNPAGKIDARNGSGYAAVEELYYAVGVPYQVQMLIDVASKSYRVVVTPPDGTPVVIADNYSFRSEQSTVPQLDNFTYLTWTGGAQSIARLMIPEDQLTLGPLTSSDHRGPLVASDVAAAAELQVSKEIRLVSGCHATDEKITIRNLAATTRWIEWRVRDEYNRVYSRGTSSGDWSLGINDSWFIGDGDPALMVSWRLSMNASITAAEYRLMSGGVIGAGFLRLGFSAMLGAGEAATVTIRRQLCETVEQASVEGVPIGPYCADLAALTINDGTLQPAFAAAIIDYSVVVAHGTSALTITPLAVQPESTVEVNGIVVPNGGTCSPISLAIGSNPIAINVTAGDGILTRNYELTATRVAAGIDGWRYYWFGSSANSGAAADLGDSDCDGLVNLLEFALGSNPRAAQPGEPLMPRRVGENMVLSLPTPVGVTGITYGAQWSATMAATDWHAIPDTGSGGTHTFSVPCTGQRKVFMRLTVTSGP